MRPKIISDSRLLELATEVIIQRGPEAFTLRMVAKHAKVSPATLIKRFKTRDILLKKCIAFHTSKMIDEKPLPETRLEDYIKSQSRNLNKENFIQHLSLLANDMREPVLKKITQKYFEGFRSSIHEVVKNDKRFDNIKNKQILVFQLEALFHGAIIQGAFLNTKLISRNVEERISEYIFSAFNINLDW